MAGKIFSVSWTFWRIFCKKNGIGTVHPSTDSMLDPALAAAAKRIRINVNASVSHTKLRLLVEEPALGIQRSVSLQGSEKHDEYQRSTVKFVYNTKLRK